MTNILERAVILKKLGLSERESMVYLTLLKYGQLSIVKLSMHTGIHRPALYNIIPKLISRDIVAEVINRKRKEFLAKSPRSLSYLVEQSKIGLENIITELEKDSINDRRFPHVETHLGKGGIRAVFYDIVYSLPKNSVFYRYSSREDLLSNDYLPKNYREIRDQKQIERFVITNQKLKETKRPRLERSIRVLPGFDDIFNITKIIYGPKISYIDYKNDFAFTVVNKKMADLEIAIFRRLYSELE
ncbi:MAG: helix-turn-helix domain-containing protein [Patescibacteria group bacterium]